MADRDNEIRLQGRLIAMELVLRALLADACHQIATAERVEPDVVAAKMRDKFMGSLQHIERPVGDYEDEVWEAASASMQRLWEQVIKRAAAHGNQTEGSSEV